MSLIVVRNQIEWQHGVLELLCLPVPTIRLFIPAPWRPDNKAFYLDD